MKSSGHVALVTGGATGIGFALAKKFLASGNQVILVGRNETALREACQRLPGASFCAADVAKSEDRARLVGLFPGVTILVNNAGIQVYKPVEESTPDEVEHEIAVNLTAPILLAQCFLPTLKKHPEAAIINVTSGLALIPKQATAIYCATKAGLHSASRSLRWQLEHTPVRVFEVLPPFVETAMTAHRGQGGLKPDQLAEEFWQGFTRERYEMLIGLTKILRLIERVSPSLAERMVRHRV
jgi:uncharacterized oxidoreductase